jgi:hypothetical protein
MLYLGLPAADITLSLLSRGPARADENFCSHAENLNCLGHLELVGLIQTASFSLLNFFWIQN